MWNNHITWHKNDNEQITKELNILDIRNYGISRIMIGN